MRKSDTYKPTYIFTQISIRPHKQTSLFHIPTRTQYLELIWSRACGKCAALAFWKFNWCLSMKVERLNNKYKIPARRMSILRMEGCETTNFVYRALWSTFTIF